MLVTHAMYGAERGAAVGRGDVPSDRYLVRQAGMRLDLGDCRRIAVSWVIVPRGQDLHRGVEFRRSAEAYAALTLAMKASAPTRSVAAC
jgi:hypothetical protein